MAQYAQSATHAEPVESAGGIANAAPLGLSAFALTTAVLSCVNAGFIVPSTAVNIFIGLALFYGGGVQILAGMWEFKRGNVIPATAFSSYGGFWVATAVIFIPGFGILQALNSAGTLHQALGLFFLCWAIFTALVFLAALRTNIALLLVLGFLFLTYLLLTIAQLMGGNLVTTMIGGWLGIVTALVAWYTALADMLVSANGAFRLPVGHLG
ncbi:MAG TPA: acetate uptake transporter [Ktedonobacteraceae bacterium]|nr:acetate uptake transporter [Ktedonobacteraceae bacterium]